MNKILSTDNIKAISAEFGLDVETVKTVILVESSGTGFDPKTGLIKIQFEPEWFERYERTKIMNGVETQPKEWEAFNKATTINRESAMKATSWGMGQVMGFNHKEAGYNSVEAMVTDFKVGELFQLRGMLNFIASNKGIFRALQSKNWAMFAFYYNGPKFKKFNYDVRLNDAYLKLKRL